MPGSTRRAALLLLGAVLVLAPVVAATAPAYASCAAISPVGSEIVFVGTAEGDREGFTRFSVDQVWAGPALAPEIWVQSGQDQPPWPMDWFVGVASSIDIDFEEGQRYVVGASRDFRTTVCTSIPASADRAPALRPADPREPVAGGHTGAEPPMGTVAQVARTVGVLVLVVLLVVVLRRRRGRNRRSPAD